MKTINDSARAFIDLAKLGRTSLWAITLTLLLIIFINTISAFGILAFSPANVQSAFYKNFSVINELEIFVHWCRWNRRYRWILACVSIYSTPPVCVYRFCRA
jgi:hypothetical protein